MYNVHVCMFKPVWLEAELVVTSYLTEVSVQLLQQLLVADGLLLWSKRMEGGKLWHGNGEEFRSGVQLQGTRPLEYINEGLDTVHELC